MTSRRSVGRLHIEKQNGEASQNIRMSSHRRAEGLRNRKVEYLLREEKNLLRVEKMVFSEKREEDLIVVDCKAVSSKTRTSSHRMPERLLIEDLYFVS